MSQKEEPLLDDDYISQGTRQGEREFRINNLTSAIRDVSRWYSKGFSDIANQYPDERKRNFFPSDVPGIQGLLAYHVQYLGTEKQYLQLEDFDLLKSTDDPHQKLRLVFDHENNLTSLRYYFQDHDPLTNIQDQNLKPIFSGNRFKCIIMDLDPTSPGVSFFSSDSEFDIRYTYHQKNDRSSDTKENGNFPYDINADSFGFNCEVSGQQKIFDGEDYITLLHSLLNKIPDSIVPRFALSRALLSLPETSLERTRNNNNFNPQEEITQEERQEMVTYFQQLVGGYKYFPVFLRELAMYMVKLFPEHRNTLGLTPQQWEELYPFFTFKELLEIAPDKATAALMSNEEFHKKKAKIVLARERSEPHNIIPIAEEIAQRYPERVPDLDWTETEWNYLIDNFKSIEQLKIWPEVYLRDAITIARFFPERYKQLNIDDKVFATGKAAFQASKTKKDWNKMMSLAYNLHKLSLIAPR